MRLLGLIAAASTLLAACGSRDEGAAAPAREGAQAAPPVSSAPASPSAGTAAAAGWNLRSRGDDVELALRPQSGDPTLSLSCSAKAKSLRLEMPGFRPIGSEERLSFGSGGEVVALVARGSPRDPSHKAAVSGAGPVPSNLAALIGGPVSVSYGAQKSGPHPAPPSALALAFVAACRPAPGATPALAPAAPAGSPGPCRIQDGARLSVAPLRAVGTEPFWGARIEGRCVTYSHPDDQKGTRIWTRFVPAPGGGRWSGSLGGRPFELEIRPRPGCSDGMSDRRYPLAAELLVGGERRRGCAEPAS
jgi:uncharacterized membrane protein